MRFSTIIRSLACSGASIIWLCAGDASAGARDPLVVPGVGPDWPVAPYARRTAHRARHVAYGHYAARPAHHARHWAHRHARPADSALLYGSYAAVYYGARPYDHSYRPAAYNAADAYPPPAPRAYGYIFPPAVEPPYSAAYCEDAWIGAGAW